jgi:cell division protein FtsI (penicillin-binding protein 3)
MKAKKLLSLMAILICTCSQISAQLNECKIQSALKEGVEKCQAESGLIVVMDTRTGKIVNISSVGLNNDKDKLIQEKIATKLFSATALNICLQSHNISLNDSIDTEAGIMTYRGTTIRDHNWRRGGYGEITLKDAFMYHSDIAIIKAIQKVFPVTNDYDKAVYDKTGIVVDGIDFTRYKLSPSQIVTLYNDIAKSGDTEIKLALQAAVDNVSYMRKIFTNSEDILGTTNYSGNSKGINIMEFCGFFPSQAPKYTVYVRLNKKKRPAFGGMAAGVFKKIYDIYKVSADK